MTDKALRHDLFVRLIDSINLSRGGIARWMYHCDTKKTRDYVSRKYTGKVAVTPSDISLLHLLKEMQVRRFDLKFEFQEMESTGLVVPN